jgi:ABC-type branched-subunit amino acid transport system substrate-binding protein
LAALGALLAAHAAQAAPNKIVIGDLDDMSGPYADILGAGGVEAIKMAIADFGGTVLGQPIFITADYAFGTQLENGAASVVKAGGGTVVGDVRAPLGTSDFASYLLQAQGSGAQVLGLANAGTDFSNSLKAAPNSA